MHKRLVSALTIGSLLGFASVLGAFAPLPTPPHNAYRMPIADEMMAPSDSDADNNMTTDEDNSAVNKGDQSKHAATADHAGNSTSDRTIMQKIRKAVVADKSLSTMAQNVKIIAKNSKVTLKGPVQSEQEKQSIEAKAVEVAGNGNVRDKLTVKNSAD